MSDDRLPPMRIEIVDAARREPGVVLFNVRPGGRQRDSVAAGWIVGIDQAGEIAFDARYDSPVQDVCLTPNGTILFTQPGAGLIREVDRGGRALGCWHASGKWRNKAPPAGSIAIEATRFHHTVEVMPGGNLLLLGNELRHFDDWPGSDTDPGAPRESADVVGDVILEVAPDGAIVREWRMLDILDPYRICYGSRRVTAVNRDWPGSNDWAHANCASYDASDDSILVSLRTQDCIAKIERATGALKWILGPPGNWRRPWSEKLLTPMGALQWQYHQHDCSVTPAGTVLCFDNGNCRALPFDPPMADAECYSRAVEFRVDEAAGTVAQAWAYGDAPQDRLFACFQGGARRLPETGNTFVTYGGVATTDGVPTADNDNGFGCARLLEVTPAGEVVFDLWVDDGAAADPVSYSVFRAAHVGQW
ncbi:MAG: aryl-sulfate sulfotransferase [Alphaproteobacteria bacterium]|nr:aryl-sulfate sulfotransferase [Alphaproteobacteria bacterium]